MDHQAAYDWLMQRARNRPAPQIYYEVHHIQPRSLDGSDDPENLVKLTYREHYLAHWLLSKMYVGLSRRKMAYAFWAMGMQVGGRVISPWQFEYIKRAAKDQQLQTRKQRLEFARKHRIASIKSFAKEAVRKFQEAPDANSFMRMHRAERKVRSLYPNKRRPSKHKNHDERLARWKSSRSIG